MSFKLGHFFYLAISFIIGSFFFIFGVFSLILPWSSYLQTLSTQFILENTLILSLFGLGFTLIGLSIFTYAFLKTGYHYIEVRTGKLSIVVNENVIRQYLETYWQQQFPQSHISFDLILKKHSLQIIADLPPLTLAEQKIFLERAKQDFSDLFGRVLGYPHDVQFIASFQAAQQT